MPLVTLIGEKLASEGAEFIYLGPNNDCRNCKLKTVCFNLKANRHYRITNIRDKKHACKIHEGSAAVVEVEELPIVTSISKEYFEGSKTKIEKEDCNSIGCEYYEICRTPVQKDKEYTITKVIEDIKCPLNYKIQKVEIKEE